MKIRILFVSIAVTLILSTAAFAAGKTAAELAENAISNDTATSSAAVRNLRAMGMTGLDALFVHYAGLILSGSLKQVNRTPNGNRSPPRSTPSRCKKTTIHRTSIGTPTAAKHKPILTLRLLGNLNEEFSFANSRLFRAILY